MSLTLCGTMLAKDLQKSCTDAVIAGYENIGVIINKADVESYVTNGTRTNVIESIVLKAGKKGYGIYVPNNNPFTGTITTMTKGANSNKFDKSVGFIILDDDADVSIAVDSLTNGEFIVILERKFKNLNKAINAGDSAFVIFGVDKGLFAEEISNDALSEDTDGGWTVVLKETGSPYSKKSFFDTDYSTTKAAFDALKA